MLVDKNKSVSLLYVGTKLFFHANSAKKKKISINLSTNMVALSCGYYTNQPKI